MALQIEQGLRTIPADSVQLQGDVQIPAGAKGTVLFAHGSGSSRLSPRNNFVADRLREKGLGTMLFDLLTVEEDLDPTRRFDIELITARLLLAKKWIEQELSGHGTISIGFFGSSTGSAAALKAAARDPANLGAVVSRGGRPDLALQELLNVETPTLLIVGERDHQVKLLNEQALTQLTAEKELRIIPGAGHLFEEPGALERVTEAAADWFERYL